MKKVAVALSGGVDSLVAAFLLKQQRYDVIGIHFLSGYGPAAENERDAKSDDHLSAAAPGTERLRRHLAAQLDIPIFVLDCRREFKNIVVDYFADSYQRAKTPNPCLVCNPRIKFDIVKTYAHQLGADYFATGHYARVETDAAGTTRLLAAYDRKKDQSYFLARLSATALSDSLFPMGAMQKQHTLRLAAEKNLQPFTVHESQDVCFVGAQSYSDFLARRFGFGHRSGPITDRQGNRLGEHNGLHRFTVGQRKGINIPARAPYYVLELDHDNNRLVVGFKPETYRRTFSVRDLHWINGAPEPGLPFKTRIRYRHKAAWSCFEKLGSSEAVVRFDQRQSAITPGQGAVFYAGEEVLGCGWIEA